MIQRGDERTNWILLPIFQPSLMSFCTKGLPRVAESTFQKVKENLLPGEKVPYRDYEGWRKGLFPGPLPSTATAPLSRRVWVIFSMMDSATSPFSFAQNDREGGMLWKVKVFGLENPTQRKSVAISMDFLMMLYVLVLDCCHVHRFWIDAHCFLIDPFLWQRT